MAPIICGGISGNSSFASGVTEYQLTPLSDIILYLTLIGLKNPFLIFLNNKSSNFRQPLPFPKAIIEQSLEDNRSLSVSAAESQL